MEISCYIFIKIKQVSTLGKNISCADKSSEKTQNLKKTTKHVNSIIKLDEKSLVESKIYFQSVHIKYATLIVRSNNYQITR